MGVLCSVRGVGGRAPLTWLTLLFSLALPLPGQAVDLDREVTVEIAAQPLASAAIEFGRQTGVQVVTAGADLTTLSSPGVSGTHRLGEALRLLLRGTGMEFKSVGEVTVALVSTVGTIPLPPEEPDDVVHLDSMIVTAGKREQNINEVAGSVTALSGDMLEKRNAQSMKDYLKLVPGITLPESGPEASPPIIRGIATATYSGGIVGAKTTGMFVDEIPMADLFIQSSIIDMNPFDLERVEVLKGPQGTLFGSSSIAGAVRYITNKPELNVWQAKANGTYTAIGDGGQKPLGAAMVNAPIGESIALRGVGLCRKEPGYIDDTNRGIKDTGEIDQCAERVLGRWVPTDRLNLTATWLHQDTHSDDVGFADQRERLERASVNGPTLRDTDFSVANLVGSYDFDWGTALSNSSHVTKDNFGSASSDRAAPGDPNKGTEGAGVEDQSQPVLVGTFRGSLEGLTQEVRLSSPDDGGRWHWLAGLAYLRFDSFDISRQPNPFLNASPPVSPIQTPLGRITGSTDTVYAEFDGRATEAALFGEVSRLFLDRWEIALGGRLFRTRLLTDTLIISATGATSSGWIESRSDEEIKASGFNPKLSARLLMSPNVNLYALVAKGFQFGGVQLRNPSLSDDAVEAATTGPEFKPFKSSELWNYEVGARTEWWDRRLQADVTLFHMVWKDLQLAQTVSVFGAGIDSIYTNLGKATSRGAEVALKVTPVPGVGLQSAASWVNAVTEVPLETSAGTYPPGTQLPGSARFQIANVLSYEQPFSFLGDWGAGLSLTHTYISRMFSGLDNAVEYGGYSTLDAGAHLLNNDLRWQPELSVSLSNLLDTRGVSGISSCLGCRFEDVFFVRPRTAMVALTMRLY